MSTVEPDGAVLVPRPDAQERGRAFASLRIPSFRWWFVAQIFSGSGAMAQLVGQAWLVLRVLHGGGLALGALSAVGFTPVLAGSAWAGARLHHMDVRRALIATQVAAAVAGALGLLAVTGVVRLWMLFPLAVAYGCISAFDAPARQLYVVNLVGRDRVASAVGLYEVIINASRVLGPASGGVILALSGVAACFFVNAASYAVPLVVLLRFRPDEADDEPAARTRTLDTLRAGSRTCAGRPRSPPACSWPRSADDLQHRDRRSRCSRRKRSGSARPASGR